MSNITLNGVEYAPINPTGTRAARLMTPNARLTGAQRPHRGNDEQH